MIINWDKDKKRFCIHEFVTSAESGSRGLIVIRRECKKCGYIKSIMRA